MLTSRVKVLSMGRMIVLVFTSRVKVLSMSRTIMLVFTSRVKVLTMSRTIYSACVSSRVKVKNIIVLVATGRVKVLSISRLLAAKFFLLWQQPMPALTAPVLPAPKPRICHLFNARDGPCCTYRQYKSAHICSQCRGPHPRSICGRQANRGPEASVRNSAAGSHKYLGQE